MKTIRRLFMILAFLGVFGTTPPIFADKILDVVGESVNSELKTALKIQKSNGEKIENKRNQLIRELAEINSRLEAAQLELTTGREQLKAMAGQRQRLEKEISTRLAGKEELESIMRDATRNLLGRAEKSPGSAEHPENIQTLKSILDEKHLLGMAELETLINICFKDMANSATRKQYTGTVLDRNGGNRGI